MIKFSKYSATGNDFIVIDNRDHIVDVENDALWRRLCKRRLNIGADGVLLVESSEQHDFKMRYINSDDGKEAEMCGNGGRAILHFYHQLTGKTKSSYSFETVNSVYDGEVLDEHKISLRMTELYDENKVDVSDLSTYQHQYYINTGVPHVVLEVDSLDNFDVHENGKTIRNDARYANGTNVNFVEIAQDHHFRIRTYERGVEKETLSCGTGITAAALAFRKWYQWNNEIHVESHGGDLAVDINDDRSEIYLKGDVHEVFTGNFTP